MQRWKIVRSEGKNVLGHTIINKPRLFFQSPELTHWVEIENLEKLAVADGMNVQFTINADQLIVEWLQPEVTESAV